MKKYRPYCAGFIVLYILGLLCVGDAVVTLVGQLRGTQNTVMGDFSLFSYLIAALALVYVKLYASARIEIDANTMRIVCPFYVRPKAGEKRAFFMFRQADTDIRLIDKKFPLAELEKYGFIDDLGYKRLDASETGPTNLLFPVQEVALVMKDGRRYHMNAGLYTGEQLRQMVDQIRGVTGIEPTGALTDPVAAKEKIKADGKAKKKAK